MLAWQWHAHSWNCPTGVEFVSEGMSPTDFSYVGITISDAVERQINVSWEKISWPGCVHDELGGPDQW